MMSKNEQGVLQPNKYRYSFIQLLLPVIFCFSHLIYSDTTIADERPANSSMPKHRLHIIYTHDSTLQSGIALSLAETLSDKRSDIIITTAEPDSKILVNKKPDIIVAIGVASIHSAKQYYAGINKLFISISPDKYRPNKSSNTGDAILYMTQPYCRQIRFIKLINNNWNSFSILTDQKDTAETRAIQACADKYDLKAYPVATADIKFLAHDIENTLDNSDLLLALPNKNIYNEKTVKNILLTSYRHRKPVIGFSKNFVTSGALAAVHSNTEHVSSAASTLIEKYLSNNHQFTQAVNHPTSYDISINRQVFKALNLDIPDIIKIKEKLDFPQTDKQKGLQ